MRHVTLELDYESAWRKIFGPNSKKVEVLEGMRCFKCDLHGFAMICKIRLKDKLMKVKDLLGKGLLTNIETLYKEKDGSLVVFIEGRSVIPEECRSDRDVRGLKVILARCPEFLDINKMKVELVGKEKEIQKFLQCARKWKMSHKLLGLASVETGSKSHLSKLTTKQRQALLTAYALGYYDIPRRITSEELSRHLNLNKSTVVEHIRKAEKKLLGDIIAH